MLPRIVESLGTSNSQRNLNCLVVSLVLTFALPFSAYAQKPEGSGKAVRPATTSAAQSKRSRRETAIELIETAAENAQTIGDLDSRTQLLLASAEALWPNKPVRARTIFIRAWEAATALDQADQADDQNSSGLPSTVIVTEARDEVLHRVGARDTALAATMLEELVAEEKRLARSAAEAANTDSEEPKSPWRDPSEVNARRLALANRLLSDRNPSAAERMAGPAVSDGPSAELIMFIIRLNEQSPALAETLFASLLRMCAAAKALDANDVLLLSAPVMSQRLLIAVDDQGSVLYRTAPVAMAAPLFADDDYMRTFFCSTAAGVLLFPARNAVPIGRAVAYYVAINRLLPFFNANARSYVDRLQLFSTMYANQIEFARRETLNAQIATSGLSPGRADDPLRPQLDQLGRANGASDRDRIAVNIVRKAAQERLWDRARRATAEIEDISLRQAAVSFLALNQISDISRAFSNDKEQNFESFAKFVRKADVPAVARVWGLAQIAVLSSRNKKPDRANELFDEAERILGSISAGTSERAMAYTILVRMSAPVDSKRAWRLLPDLLTAANAARDYDGDKTPISIDLGDFESTIDPLAIDSDTFKLDGAIAAMARLDAERTLDAAKTLGGGFPNAMAMLAVAREMLSTEAGNTK